MRGRRAAATGAAVTLLAAVAPALGQVAPEFPLGQFTTGPQQSPILTLDQDRLFGESAFGKRVAQEVEDAQQKLLAENRKIEAELSAEEKRLTEQRAKMAPAEFRKLADDFDSRVQKIRHDQDAKNNQITQLRDRERKRFFKEALPILGQLVRDSGAVAILNSQAIFLSFNSIDITDRAIERIDGVLGDGSAGEPAPGQPPDGAGAGEPPAAPAGTGTAGSGGN